MRRQDKYPDTKTFHYHNQNPKNRITGDCVIRALSTATEIPYNDVVMEMAKIQCETGYDQPIDQFLKLHGWVKCKQPRKSDNTKYTGKQFCEIIMKDKQRLGLTTDNRKRIIANIGGHHIVAIIDGKVWDMWDSTNGCIGNFWIKDI